MMDLLTEMRELTGRLEEWQALLESLPSNCPEKDCFRLVHSLIERVRSEQVVLASDCQQEIETIKKRMDAMRRWVADHRVRVESMHSELEKLSEAMRSVSTSSEPKPAMHASPAEKRKRPVQSDEVTDLSSSVWDDES